MAGAGFTLATRLAGGGFIEEVAAILSEPERLPEWWPAVYLAVEIIAPGDAGGLGRTVAFHTRGWLPYTLRWQARLVEDRRPHGWTIAATGDLVGRGVWTPGAAGRPRRHRLRLAIEVEKPLLKPLTPVLRPVYAANHRWAMARGLEGCGASSSAAAPPPEFRRPCRPTPPRRGAPRCRAPSGTRA